MRRVPRLGFVGVGWIGRHRMEAVLKARAAEAAAVFDPSHESMAAASQAAPSAKRVESFGELLHADIDGVVIATPNSLHADQCVQALDAGKHVFCQKPLGRNADEVRRILAASKRNDRLIAADLSYRHVGAIHRARELIIDGKLGDVFAADLAFHNSYGPDKPWFYDPALSGGGCFLDLGVHLTDAALWMLAFPRVDEVSSRMFVAGKPVTPGELCVEDYATARFDLSSGATANLSTSWRVSAGCDCIIAMTFHGTKGSVRVENVNGSFYDFRAHLLEGTRATLLAQPPDDWASRAITLWARRIAAGEGYNETEAKEHARVAETIDRVYAR